MKKLMEDCTEPELKAKFDSAMRYLENHLPGGDGPRGNAMIVLLASGTFGAGVGQYASNAERSGIIRFLRETADRLELQSDVTR